MELESVEEEEEEEAATQAVSLVLPLVVACCYDDVGVGVVSHLDGRSSLHRTSPTASSIR